MAGFVADQIAADAIIASKIIDGAITNAKINASAAIAFSKLEKNPLAADGSVSATASLPMGSNKITGLTAGAASGEAAEYDQMNTAISDALLGNDWLESAKSIELTDVGISPAPTTGDRYLINGTGAGAFSGKDNNIAEKTAGGWTFEAPTTGAFI